MSFTFAVKNQNNYYEDEINKDHAINLNSKVFLPEKCTLLHIVQWSIHTCRTQTLNAGIHLWTKAGL